MKLPPAIANLIKSHLNAIIRDVVTTLLTGVALGVDDRNRVLSRLAALDTHPDLDTDGDGVADSEDAAPNDPTIWKFDPVTGEPLPPRGGVVSQEA